MNQRIFGVSATEAALCGLAGLPVAGLTYLYLPLFAALATGLMAAMLAAITLADQRSFRIPDALSLPLTPLGLAVNYGLAPDLLGSNALAALLGAAALFGVNLAYRLLRGHDGLGLGDVKLAAAAGAWTGIDGLPLVILIACGGALATILLSRLLRLGRNHTWGTAIPFGAYLSPAILLVWLLSIVGYTG